MKRPLTLLCCLFGTSVFILGFWVCVKQNFIAHITPPPRTVRVMMFGQQVCALSNVVSVVQHEPDCTLVLFVANGVTNEFHAWMSTVEDL